MYVYKITNKNNNKVYIGQTIKSVQDRWQRHLNDSFSNKIDTHFARTIRKYGKDSFTIETIDTAKTKEELNQKEKYWIKYYNSAIDGYNLTDGGDGGNTYKYKTSQELKDIKEKIRKTKLGKKNPHSRKIKALNTITKEEIFFDTVKDCQEYFLENNHNFITSRCNNRIKCLYKGKWNFAYIENEYGFKTPYKNNRKSKKIYVIDLKTKEERKFPSYTTAEKYYNFYKGSLSKKTCKEGKEFVIKNRYKINVID